MDHLKLISSCSGCGICLSGCSFLEELGIPCGYSEDMDPSIAFGCALCGRCEKLCPEGLSPYSFFYTLRKQAVEDGFPDINEYRHLFPDRPNSMHKVLRRHMDTDYSDLLAETGKAAFFPGCAMLTYSPALTREVFRRVKEHNGAAAFSDGCCGRPLSLLGLEKRGEEVAKKTAERLAEAGVKTVLTVCPGCYYDMKDMFAKYSIKTDTVYAHLGTLPEGKKYAVTVQDACPDRTCGLFADSARKALKASGYTISEMAESRETSLCCGSGGMLPNFREDLACEWSGKVNENAKQTDAAQIITYCLSCAMKLGGADSNRLKTPPAHILNLLIGIEPDCFNNKAEAKKLLSSGESEEIWKAIMKD